MKKVLIISYSYPPSQAPAAQRPFYLAKYINKKKYEVGVLTPKVSDSSMGHADSIESLENVKITYTGNINISYLRGLKDTQKNNQQHSTRNSLFTKIKQKLYSFISSITIPDKGIIWVPFAIAKAYQVIKHNKTDLIFTTSPLFSNHIVGLVLKKCLKMYWVADFRDFYYVENYQKTTLLRRYIDKWLERNVISSADKVLFVTENMKNEYCKYYPKLKEKAYTIYNGLELEKELEVETLPHDKPLTIFYAGSFYAGERSPMPLLQILDVLIEKRKINEKEIRIRIAGNIEKFLVEEMRNYKVFKSIEFLGLVSRQKVLKEIRSSHLLWLIVGNSKNHYMTFPIKGFEYMAAQRNILAFVPASSESDHIISKYDLGFVMNNKIDSESLQQNITIFNKIIEQYRQKDLNDPIELSEEILNLTKKSQSLKIEEIMESLTL